MGTSLHDRAQNTTYRLRPGSMSKHVKSGTDPLASVFDVECRVSHELAIPFILPL